MTNFQQFVFEYLEGQKKDEKVDSCIFSNLGQLADSVLNYHRSESKNIDWNRVTSVREKISEFSLDFLRKLEATVDDSCYLESAYSKIEELRLSDPRKAIVLMSAHQPNLFAYSGVFKKLALITSVSEFIRPNLSGESIICFYGFADHDFANNKWVRSAEIPSPLRKEGVLRYNVKIDRKRLFLPSNTIPKPTRDVLDLWKTSTAQWIEENSTLAKKYLRVISSDSNQSYAASTSNFEEFWTIVDRVWEKSSNLAEFSSLLFCSVSLKMFKEPIIYANFSDCFGVFGNEYGWLLENNGPYVKVVEESDSRLRSNGIDSGLSEELGASSPLWMKCSCGSKFKLLFTDSQVFGKCVACQEEFARPLQELISLVQTDARLFEPRSISMPLVFGKAFAMSCYVGGIGGLGYLLHTRAVSDALSSPLPPTPFWYTPDVALTMEKLATMCLLRRTSDEYCGERIQIESTNLHETARKILSEITSKIASGELKRNSVTERDSQLLEKISRYNGGYPSMIEMVINYDLSSLGEQWVGFLKHDGRLQVPVELVSIWNRTNS